MGHQFRPANDTSGIDSYRLLISIGIESESIDSLSILQCKTLFFPHFLIFLSNYLSYDHQTMDFDTKSSISASSITQDTDASITHDSIRTKSLVQTKKDTNPVQKYIYPTKANSNENPKFNYCLYYLEDLTVSSNVSTNI